MVGGTGFSLTNQFNRAWQARRQPGSSFKAYVYTAAIDSGMPASTTIDDSPVSYPMGDGTRWSPYDDDGSYMGAGLAAHRAGAFAQRRRGQTGGADRRRSRDRVRAPDGYHVAAGGEPFARAWVVGRFACSIRPADTRRWRTRACTSIRRRFVWCKDSLGNVVLDNRYPQADRSRQRRNRVHHDDDAGGRHRARDGLS